MTTAQDTSHVHTPPSGHVSRTSTPGWLLAASFTAGVVGSVIFAAAGILFSRVDLALLGLPLIAHTAWAWDKRPRRDQTSTISINVDSAPVAGQLGFTVAIVCADENVSLRLGSLGGKPQEIVVTAQTARDLRGRVPILHSGPQEVLRVSYQLITADAACLSFPEGPLSAARVVPPPYTAVRNLPLPRRLQGLTGTHDSSRPGDGGDFRDIHPFMPGDRLRRIDWKATARRGRFAGDLYVRRTTATSDATVIIVLDSRDDVGEQVSEWARNRAAVKGVGSLDVAREAASSLAAGYIRAGDRVGFQDLASQSRMIAHSGGGRHLQRLLRAIELSQPSPELSYRRRPPITAPGALIYVLSTFLDEETARMAGLWRGSGHRVIAVDVLPAPRFARATRAERVAHRVVMMERSDRMRLLQAQGVEILPWQEGGGAGSGQSGPGSVGSTQTASGEPDSREARLMALSRPMRGGR